MDLGKQIGPLTAVHEHMEQNLSVDCVIFTIRNRELKVLLTRLSPKMNWMLPGGFMAKNEDADQAAKRILKYRTGVDQVYLNQFQIFSDPDRFSFNRIRQLLQLSEEENSYLNKLPDRVISMGYFALVNYEAIHVTGGVMEEETCWCHVPELPRLEFDHEHIIQEAVAALRKEVYFRPIVYKLLPEKFTLPELQALYEVILGKALDRGSFQRKMLRWDIFERLEERREGVAHKRPFLYRFDPLRYHTALERGLSFGM